MTTITRPDVQALVAGRRRRARQRSVTVAALAAIAVTLFLVSLFAGDPAYSLTDIVRVLAGDTVPGASFIVGELRLPRAVLGILVGAAFGMSGVTFQTMLRNPLASPDIIGISAGASAAAVFAIVVLSLSQQLVSVFALAGALLTALAIFLLANRGGFAGTRLILIGIGLAAMLTSIVSSVLSRAAAWDIQTAMQWLTGSLNAASWERVLPMAVASAVVVPLMLARGRDLRMLSLGDDSASGLGVRVDATRLLCIIGAVTLLAFATAAAGPIAFVAFMAGPIAARLITAGGSLLLPAALVGAILVLGADLLGQHALPGRYPVGVITGVLGAPYLLFLLIRTNRAGGSL